MEFLVGLAIVLGGIYCMAQTVREGGFGTLALEAIIIFIVVGIFGL